MEKWILILFFSSGVIQNSNAQTHFSLFVTGSQYEFFLENAGDLPLQQITFVLHNPSFPERAAAQPISQLRAGEKYEVLITIPAEYAASNAKTTLNIYSDSKLVSEQTIMFSNSILQNFQLLQNFPNPFNGTTVIAYTIPQSARTTKVILSIFDVTGKLIKTLVNTIVQPGNYSVSWNGTNSEGFSVSSGIYYYRLTAGTFQETRKIVYEK